MDRPRRLKVLILEDASDDPTLLAQALRRSVTQFISNRVVTKSEFVSALRTFLPDVVLIADTLPSDDCREAVAHARRVNPEVPIVLVAGMVSHETTLALLMAGAKNYVLKCELERLPEVIERAIEIENGIRARKAAEHETRKSEEWFRLLFENAPDAIVLYDADERHFIDANVQAELLFGCNREEITKHGPAHFYSPDQPDKQPLSDSVARHDKLALAKEQLIYERRIHRPTGEERICLVTMLKLPSESGNLLRGSFVDITDRKQAEQALERTNRALQVLSRGNALVVRSADESELMKEMCRVIVGDGGYRMSWIGEVQHDSAKTVRFIAWAGEDADRLAQSLDVTWAEVPAGSGTTGRAIRTGKAQTSQNFPSDPSMAPWAEAGKKYGIASAITLPLKDRSGVFAVLRIYAIEPNAFDRGELTLLQELADDLTYGIITLRDRSQHALMEQRWRVGLEATVGAISNMVGMRDPYTAGHQQRVANLAVAIARMLGMSEYDIRGVYLASIVHDVGKLNIPAEILNKPGTISKIEYALIQEHPETGYTVLKGIDFPWPVAEMVRQHHERIDGSGYPKGLKGKAILPEAKIIAVADVVDGMMSHRPYRPALGIEAALAEIEKGSGCLFDPAVVHACITSFREKGFSFEAR